MALTINGGGATYSVQNSLNKTTNRLQVNFKRLSTGLRVNSAKDDSAGLAYALRLDNSIRGMAQAVRNSNDALSLSQVAEAALDETTSALQRARDLMVQANNSTVTSTTRQTLQDEVLSMLAEVQRLATQTDYNDINLLTGSFSGNTFQIGADPGEAVMFSILAASQAALGVSFNGSPVAGVALGSFGQGVGTASALSTLNSNLTKLDNAMDSVASIRANLGAIQNRFESIVSGLQSVSENLSIARSRIMDADIAQETTGLARNAIIQQAGIAILTQANLQPQVALRLLG
ncbi:MAG: flagellin FliC [Magnetococcales bacterium]|nr:flagellin FliC [Magnetococcales bacterium]